MVELSLFALLALGFFCVLIGFYLSQLKRFSNITMPNDENTGDGDNLNDNDAVNDRYGLLDGKPPPNYVLVPLS